MQNVCWPKQITEMLHFENLPLNSDNITTSAVFQMNFCMEGSTERVVETLSACAFV